MVRARQATRLSPLLSRSCVVARLVWLHTDTRIDALRARWSDESCDEPRWWIVKDAHASNGFSASLLDRTARTLTKKDVAGGYCYVVQEYIDRPMLIDGRKFELRQ